MKKSTAYPAILLALFLSAYLLVKALSEDEAAAHRDGLHWQQEEPAEPVTHGALQAGATTREVVTPSAAVEATVEASPAQKGSLSVSVLDGEGRYVERVRVILRHPMQSINNKAASSTLTQGVFFDGDELGDQSRLTKAGPVSFEDVIPREKYKVLLDEATLPPGYLPPRKQSEHYEPDVLRVDIVEGGAHSLILHLERGATVQGRITDARGNGAEFCKVLLGSSKLKDLYVNTDPNGYFEAIVHQGSYVAVASVGVAPGTPWVPGVSTTNRAASMHRLKDEGRPLPQTFEAHPGSTIDLHFQFGLGAGSIRGTILDDKGKGFAGLRIVVAPYESKGDKLVYLPNTGGDTTDENGSFVFTGLSSGKYRITLDCSGYSPRAYPGASKVGRLVQPILVSLEDELELDPVIVPRSHPINIRGSLGGEYSSADVTFILSAEGKDWRLRDSESKVDLAYSKDGLRILDFWVDRFEEGGVLVVKKSGVLQPSDPLTIPIRWDRRTIGDVVELGVVAR